MKFASVGLVVAAASIGLLAPGASAAADPPALEVSATPAVGNLGGSVALEILVSGATSCTVSSARWEARAFSRTLFCGGTNQVLSEEISVPANSRPRPFRAGIEVQARGPGGTTTNDVPVTVAAAPVYPSANGQAARFEPGARNTYNWSGYVLQGVGASARGAPDFSAVAGQWTVPALRCGVTPNALSSIWLGVDGASPQDTSVFQVGVEPTCVSGAASDRAWWTDETHGYLPQDLFDVASGDVVRAEVQEISVGRWQFDIADVTSGRRASGDESYAGPGRSAEWVVEAPGSDPAPVADFGRVTFTHLGLVTNWGSWRDPPRSDAKVIAATGGKAETATSSFTGGGAAASFSVAYAGSRPSR